MRLSIFIGVLLLSAALVSCKDNATSYSVGTGNGEINGFVSLRDSINGGELSVHDFSGVTVSVEGGPQRTTTDSDGQFTLSELPNGKITLVFSKPGFAESRDVDFEYKKLYYGSRNMYQIRKLTPNLVIRPFEGAGDTTSPFKRALFSCRIIDSLKQYSGLIKLYFGIDPILSPQDPNSFLYSTPPTNVDAQDGTAFIGVFRDSLLQNGFMPNTKVYVVAFMTGFYTQNQFYIDKSTDKRIYSGLSPFNSGVKNFVLP